MHRFVIALSFVVTSACGAVPPAESATTSVCRDPEALRRLQPTVCPTLEQLVAMASRDLDCDRVVVPFIGTDWGALLGPVHLSGCERSIEYVEWGDQWVTREERTRLAAELTARSAPTAAPSR